MSPSWEEIWQGEGMPPWDMGGPSEVVLRLAHQSLSPGSRVLVPGCGSAWEVEGLARAGHQVTGLDVAPTALQRARDRVGDLAGVTLRDGDFLDLPMDLLGRFDAVVEHTCFCALAPEKLPAYVRSARDALNESGTVLGAFLNFEGGGPPFGTNPDALRGLFEPTFRIERIEPAPEIFGPARVPQLAVVMRKGGG